MKKKQTKSYDIQVPRSKTLLYLLVIALCVGVLVAFFWLTGDENNAEEAEVVATATPIPTEAPTTTPEPTPEPTETPSVNDETAEEEETVEWLPVEIVEERNDLEAGTDFISAYCSEDDLAVISDFSNDELNQVIYWSVEDGERSIAYSDDKDVASRLLSALQSMTIAEKVDSRGDGTNFGISISMQSIGTVSFQFFGDVVQISSSYYRVDDISEVQSICDEIAEAFYRN